MTRGHSPKKSLKASFRKSLTQDCSFSNLPPPYHHNPNPLTATVMDCIAEIGMDPQGVQKCVAVSVIFQIINYDNVKIFFVDGPLVLMFLTIRIANDGDQ